MNNHYSIEPFRMEDAYFVRSLFIDALENHYGGDHFTHFDRLLEAYSDSGIDKFGYNSTHQIGFVARNFADNVPVGFVNFVIKKQDKVKISPLIVAPEVRGQGIGKLLLDSVVKFSPKSTRSLYCTVDRMNKLAANFFIREGFQLVGSSKDQYRSGHSEMIFQKMLYDPYENCINDIEFVSTQEVNRWDEFEKIFNHLESNEKIPRTFAEILGASSRESNSVDLKSKVTYLVYNGNELVGACIFCGKKGGSTKISTLFWKDIMTLNKIISQLDNLPEFFNTQGRVYIQMPVISNFTRIFQRNSWRLDALIPDAELPNEVIAQWSKNVYDSETYKQMTWNDYQITLQELVISRDWNMFETPQELMLSLVAEVGELAQEFQWKSVTPNAELNILAVANEIADIYHYLQRIAWHLDIDMLSSGLRKLEEVQRIFPL